MKAIHAAYERAKPVRDYMRALGGHPLQTVEGRTLIELWVLGLGTVVLWATADGWDVYGPVCLLNDSQATFDALKLLSARDSQASVENRSEVQS